MKHHLPISLFLMVCGLLIRIPALQGQPDNGTPLMQQYSKKEYQAHARNFSIIEGKDGRVYLGNSNGLLVYDGIAWQMIAENLIAVQMDAHSPERMYVAAYDDLGYLEATDSGSFVFESLADKLPDSEKEVVFVTNVVRLKQYVYFAGEDVLYAYDTTDRSFVVHRSDHIEGLVNYQDTVYLVDINKGFCRMEGTRIVVVDSTFENEEGIRGIYPTNQKGQFLIVTTQGLLHYDRTGLHPLMTEADDIFRRDAIYTSTYTQSRDGTFFYIIGTSNQGVLILDENGKQWYHIRTDNGLINNNIADLCVDQQGFLWVATGNGITKVALHHPYTSFGQRIENSVLDILHTQAGERYVATNTGLLIQEGEQFVPLPETVGTQCWQLHPFRDQVVLAGGNFGFYYIRDGQVRQNVSQSWATMSVEVSRRRPHRLYQSCYQGFYLLDYQEQADTFRVVKQVEAFDSLISRSVVEDTMGNVWVGAIGKGFFRFRWDKPDSVTRHIKGLDDLSRCYVWEDQGMLFFTTRDGIFQYDAEQDRFVSFTPDWMKALPEGIKAYYFYTDQNQNVWLAAYGLRLSKLPKGAYRCDTLLLEAFTSNVYAFHSQGDSIFWMGNDDGLFAYHPSWDFALPQKAFRTMLYPPVFEGLPVTSGGNRELPYANNSVRFDARALSFLNESENSYQFSLIKDGKISATDWTKEPFKEYTNLWEGPYTLRVQARDALGRMGVPVEYGFVIRPPAYRTTLAYVLYAVLMSLGIWLAIWLNSRRLRRANERLETVRERTSEIQQQKEEISIQAEALQDALALAQTRKKEIEAQHRKISDSIVYAERIQ